MILTPLNSVSCKTEMYTLAFMHKAERNSWIHSYKDNNNTQSTFICSVRHRFCWFFHYADKTVFCSIEKCHFCYHDFKHRKGAKARRTFFLSSDLTNGPTVVVYTYESHEQKVLILQKLLCCSFFSVCAFCAVFRLYVVYSSKCASEWKKKK